MSRNSSSKIWWPEHIKGANAQWDPLAGVGAFSEAWALDHRVLFLTTPIEPHDNFDDGTPGVGRLIMSLMMLDAMDPGAAITLYINSVGGDVAAGLALIQTMRDLRSPVTTFVMQQAASMAAVVAVAGIKRKAFPASRWLLHRDFGVAHGDYEDLSIAAKELKLIDKTADLVIVNFTKIRADQLDEMQRKDFWLGCKEALRLGIIDEAVSPHKGPAWQSWLPTRRKGEDDAKPA